jgi:hypothetical protein
LITELQRIASEMPGPGSEGMRVPSSDDMLTWSALVEAASRGDLGTACRVLAEHRFPYQVVEFTDLPHESNAVVLLREVTPVVMGWGTYVFRPTASKALLIEVPHPLSDSRTRAEGVTLFRALTARALLMAGTHRCANAGYASCGGTTIACGQVEPYRESDVAHASLTMFQAAHQTLAPCDGESVTLQLHGNSLATCPDLFISNGTTNPGGLARSLHRNSVSACADFSVDLADGEAGECGFLGDGAQAAYDLTCRAGFDADSCTGGVRRRGGPDRYLSLEQSWELRQDYSCLVEALERTFP